MIAGAVPMELAEPDTLVITALAPPAITNIIANTAKQKIYFLILLEVSHGYRIISLYYSSFP